MSLFLIAATFKEIGPVHMEVGDPREGEVPRLPVVKKGKKASLHMQVDATPGRWGEVLKCFPLGNSI